MDKQWALAGDLVEIHLEGAEGRIDRILPRRTCLERPPVANIDQALLIFTLHQPEADYPFLDRILIHAEQAGVEVLILLGKADLLAAQEIASFCHCYGDLVGYRVLPISAKEGMGLDALRPLLAGKTSVLAGHSGVGKSRLARALEPDRGDILVGDLSAKLGRGKHTTRHVELIPLTGGGLLADAPGFTYLEFPEIDKWSLREYFPEMRRLAGQCRFDDCLHRKEPDCAVQAAVAAGAIAQSRYESYLAFLAEVEARKRW